jgi:capsular exopolysaccharide synthesis family protein
MVPFDSAQPLAFDSNTAGKPGHFPTKRSLQPLHGGGPAQAPAATPSGRPNLVGLMQALRRRWLLGFTLGLLGALLAGLAAWYLVPPSSTVRTLLRVYSVQPHIVFNTAEGRADFFNYQRSQVALLRTRFVLSRALRNVDVANLVTLKDEPDPVAWLEKHIQADYAMAPEIFRIALTGEHPEDLKKLVTEVREAYVKEIADKEHEKRFKRLDQLKQLFDKFDTQLQQKREKLRKMAESLGSNNSKWLVLQQQYALTQLNSVQSELISYQTQLRRASVRMKIRQDKMTDLDKEEIPAVYVDEALNNDELVRSHLKTLKQLDRQLAQMRENLHQPDADQGYQKRVALVAETKKALEDRRKELRPKIKARLREEAKNNLLAGDAKDSEEFAELTRLEKELTQIVRERAKSLDAMKQGTINVEWLQDEIAEAVEMVKMIGKQKAALEVEIEAPRRVDPIPLEEAIVSNPHSPGKRIRTSALAGIAVFGLALFGVCFFEFRAGRVNNAEEVVQGLGLKLMGTLPLLPEGVRRRLGGPKSARDVHWQNRFNESLNAARTALLHTARQESLQVIMVTSALQGEGKSLVSCHLAVSLARAGYKTLLVDGDLRRPAVHKLFAMEAVPGLSEVLRGEVVPEGAVKAGPVEGLAVMPAGNRDEKTLRALAQGHAGVVWDGFKEAYDFIVIDSPPVLAVADALLIGQQADGVVFSVLRDVSRLPALHAAYDRLAMLNIRILGAVVNGGPSPLYGSDYTPESLPASQA